ncbi:hypothetical protein CHLRE_08g358542v5 [Chlamydomonas reinhardtii]|nr:uncharacterized protein CHLRE_08g358542v5 [Chlamydomonas reinhardtii]PNW79534.1 hypothetical protein CHLRE_08g358542v5 [Chlamydomonas reinhardtii]
MLRPARPIPSWSQTGRQQYDGERAGRARFMVDAHGYTEEQAACADINSPYAQDPRLIARALIHGTAAGEAGAAAAAPQYGAAGRRERRGVPAAAAESEELGRLLFPRARTRRLDETASDLGGRRVRRAEEGPDGVLEYLGALARPRYFRVQWSDGEEQQLTLAEARRLLAD